MTDLSKLTAKDFSDAMHRGWRGRKWCHGAYYLDSNGACCDQRAAMSCCAIGAMAIALKTEAGIVDAALEEISPDNIIHHDNLAAGNKRAAMKAVDAILLNTPAVRGGAK